MKIIVDTNIIFSALLNSESNIGDLIFNSGTLFQFYSCNYMRYEIRKHWDKLKKISKLSDENLEISFLLLISKIKFINEDLIPREIWIESESIANKIDINDIDFIALTKFLKATLWTGDKTLYNGLQEINFKKVFNTNEIILLRQSKAKK